MDWLCTPSITDWITAAATIGLVFLTKKYVKLTRIISETAVKAPKEAFDNGLKMEQEKHDRIINELTDGLDLIAEPQEGNTFSIRIVNTTSYPILNASVSITIDYHLSDVLQPVDFSCWIRAGHLIPVVEEKVCWAHTEGGKWSSIIDIYPQEEQTVSLFVFDEKNTSRSVDAQKVISGKIGHSDLSRLIFKKLIKVYSTEGVGDSRMGNARVALEGKDYTFWIKVVGQNIKAKAWECKFHFSANNSYIEKIKEMSIDKLREKQNEIREREDIRLVGI